MTDIKVLLNNILPAEICDEICDYNLYCSKCKDLNKKEPMFMKRYRHKQLTRPELHIYFFQTEMSTPIYLSNTNKTQLRIFRKEIDDLLESETLKQQFIKDKTFFQAVKSLIKKDWKFTHHLLKNFHGVEYIKHMRQCRAWWLPSFEKTYMFRKREFKKGDLYEVFFKEYLKQLFKGYEDYYNPTEIEEHLLKVIDT